MLFTCATGFFCFIKRIFRICAEKMPLVASSTRTSGWMDPDDVALIIWWYALMHYCGVYWPSYIRLAWLLGRSSHAGHLYYPWRHGDYMLSKNLSGAAWCNSNRSGIGLSPVTDKMYHAFWSFRCLSSPFIAFAVSVFSVFVVAFVSRGLECSGFDREHTE